MATEPQVPAHRGTRANPALTLAVVLLGLFTLTMAMSGTTVALPRIGADLDASGVALNWVVTGYFLAASSFMLVAGSLGDIFGRRKVFALGATVYTLGTVGAAFSQNILALDAARVLSGIGAAGVMGSGGALIATTFAGAARAKAFGMVGTVAGVGLALGPTLSGWMVDGLGWRPTFLAFAAVGTVLVLGATRLGESTAEVRPRVDKAGAGTFIAGLALTLFAITQGSKQGWVSVYTLLPLAAGLTLFTLFVRIEKRIAATGGQPILDLALARNRTFIAWPLGAFGIGAGTTATLVFLPTYLQGTSGFTARDAGLVLLFLSIPMLVMPPVGTRLASRGIPARRLMVGSLLLLAAGNLWLSTLHAGITVGGLAGPLVTLGIGAGLPLGLIDVQALSGIEAGRTGMASGFLGTVRGATGAVMLTLFAALLLAVLEARAGSPELAGKIAAGAVQGAEPAGQFTEALRVGLWAIAALSAGLALLVHGLLRPRGRTARTARTTEVPKIHPAALSESTTAQTR
ncbi:MFS transporter [Streptomyces sp. T-3]|nr:MFS transporter [Streptomyces sp. T-3]